MNPTPFISVTFPLMFGMMFGDIGHGIFLFLLGVVLVFLPASRVGTLASRYRYMVLLLGLMAVYCGLLYNEAVSVPLTFFRSCYAHRV